MYSENRQLEEYNHHGMRVNAPSIGCGLSLLYGYRCLAIPQNSNKLLLRHPSEPDSHEG